MLAPTGADRVWDAESHSRTRAAPRAGWSDLCAGSRGSLSIEEYE
jgi:hypothetical protein